ncbi:hypothetical protein CYY_008068 [Polysphondylium violaceum]|uniref:TLDc domain-containing protein n=1 Tax=Polysphondylium violaceum TaxID=133409 RepID=A0A8J4PPU0_9MYCE|nr:hypothetical protein CYY_008068 [Polysphondylium violaceum]
MDSSTTTNKTIENDNSLEEIQEENWEYVKSGNSNLFQFQHLKLQTNTTIEILRQEISKLNDLVSKFTKETQELKDVNQQQKSIENIKYTNFMKNHFKSKSTIIDRHSFSTINDWIDKSNILNFKLLYRASDNEYKVKLFHSKCDGKGPTVTIFKTTDGDIFGGYNSQSWNSTKDYYGDDKCFIFTLVNRHSIEPTQFRIKDSTKYYCFSHPHYGPSWGGHDIVICQDISKSYQCFPFSYSDTLDGKGSTTLTPTKYLNIKDYEVFSISKEFK